METVHHFRVIDYVIDIAEETLILSIKDDCIPFDFEERRKIMDPDDKTKNIGIRIVSGLASDIKHQNILGLNVMTIRLDAPA